MAPQTHSSMAAGQWHLSFQQRPWLAPSWMPLSLACCMIACQEQTYVVLVTRPACFPRRPFPHPSAAQSRASTVLFSRYAVIKEIDGRFWFQFRVVEMRKHQVSHCQCFNTHAPGVVTHHAALLRRCVSNMSAAMYCVTSVRATMGL